MLKTLLVENRQVTIDTITKQATQLEIELLIASSLAEVEAICTKNDLDILLLPDVIDNSATCYSIHHFQELSEGSEILIYSEEGDIDHAEIALQSGVWDYVVTTEPEVIIPEMLRRVVRFCHNKKTDVEKQEREVRYQLQDYGIIGSSPAIKNSLNLVAKLGQSDASVLITGETGTGKELFASAIHTISVRANNRLVVVDCAALPSTLVESILFGHVKGAFTGAEKTKQGLIKQADRGTLFLDEVAEMPMEIQKKFLRVLQEMNYYQVGNTTPQSSDFRLIAATNKDLDSMVADGTFREDLLFRLKTFQLELPPLRQRKNDVAELVYHFRNTYCKKHNIKRKKLTTNYLSILSRYEWPGNVRELFQTIEFSLESAQQSEILDIPHLPVNIRLRVTHQEIADDNSTAPRLGSNSLPEHLDSMPTIKEDRDRAIDKQEKRYLKKLLELSSGNIKACCKVAGLSRSRLYDLLKKHNLTKTTSVLHGEE